MEVSIRNNTFNLDSLGAVYWKEEDTLLVADLHIGKVHHFRKAGIAIPLKTLKENFSKMDTLIHKYNPAHILFLGDLFHSDKNNEWSYFFDWLDICNCKFTLVVGNHDKTGLKFLPDSKMKVVDDYAINDFLFTHHPKKTDTQFNFCGHVHPGFLFQSKGKFKFKMSCFALNENQMILPAFGAFTGLYTLKKKDFKTLYLIADQEIIKI